MIIDAHTERVQNDLRAAAALGGPELTAAVDQLAQVLDASLRIAVTGALAAAADELSAELAPSSVAVQIVGDAPRLVAHLVATEAPTSASPADVEPSADDAEVARVSLRIGAALKRQVDAAASREQMSTNTWIAHAIAQTLRGTTSPLATSRRGQMRGWAY